MKNRHIYKFCLMLTVAFFTCISAASAANVNGKPSIEAEVPGNWTVDMADLSNSWFADANWGGVSLSQYSQIIRNDRFPDPDLSLFGDHPDFTQIMRENENNPNGVIKVLSNAQMNDYLETLPKDNLTIRYLGDYPEGIRAPLLVFSKPKLSDPSGKNLRDLGKPIFYLRAQVHGNEIAATGGAILLAQRLARKHPDLDGILDKMSIIILPRMNGDGAKIHQRGTSLVSGDTWGTGAPDFHASIGPGGGVSEYGGGIMGGFDQNRDNLWLSSPVSRANARILAEYKPEICMDAHEYECNSYYGVPVKTPAGGGGFIYQTDPDGNLLLKDAGGTLCYYKEQITTQWANHLIIPQNLRNIMESIQQKIASGLEDTSNPTGPFFWATYVDTRGYGLAISGDVARGGLIALNEIPAGAQRDSMSKWVDANGMVPELTAIARSVEGGFDPSIARNSMALIPGISFLVESRSAGGRWEYSRRVLAQYLTAYYYLKAVLDDLDSITSAVRAARSGVIDAGKSGSIDSMPIALAFAPEDYSNVVTQGVYYHDGTSEDIIGRRANSRFGTVSTFERKRPYAYVMDGNYPMADEIVFRMSHLGIEFQRILEPVEIEVTAYTVTSANPSPSFGATSRVTGVTEETITKMFPAGSYVFYMEQQMANFIALLFEPMSLRSWIGKDVINTSVIVGKEVPFYRYERTSKISPAEKIEIFLLDFTQAMLINAIPYKLPDLKAEREATKIGDGFGQIMTIYGSNLGARTLRAYLPNEESRNWYVLNVKSGKYERKSVKFDDSMHRSYVEIEPDDLTLVEDGYHVFNLFVAQPGNNHFGSGCNFGTVVLASFLVVFCTARIIKRKRKYGYHN